MNIYIPGNISIGGNKIKKLSLTRENPVFLKRSLEWKWTIWQILVTRRYLRMENYMNKVKATAHSHTGDKPIGVNNSEHSQAVVSVNLPNAWLYYDKLGFKMVPLTLKLVNGKKVVMNMPRWKKQALASASIKPRHNALAIITGEESQLMVIDIDITGTSLSAALTEYGLEIANYCYALTPSGGLHIYLNWSNDEFWKKRYQRKTLTTTNRKIGIDIRAEGGLIFAPPSIVEGGGNYQWINIPVNRRDLVYDPDKLIPLMDAIFSYNPNPSPLAPAAKQFIMQNINCPNPNEDESYKNTIISNCSPTEAKSYSPSDYQNVQCLIESFNERAQKIEYLDWIKMGFAIKNAFGNDGLNLWLMFANNPAYSDDNPSLLKKWNSFQNPTAKLGSFYYLAEKYLGIPISFVQENKDKVA